MTSTAVNHLAETLADAVKQLAATKRPVLYLDTCALLDVVRAPCRDRTDHLLAAVARIEKAARAKRVVLCAAEITRDEWVRNIDVVLADVERSERDTDRAVQQFVIAAQRAGKPRTARARIGALEVPPKLRGWSERMLQSTVLVAPTAGVIEAAWGRQAQRRLPARRGKDSVGDCTIFETLLAIGRGLGSTQPLVFLTSNTQDFGHPDLAMQLAPVGATAAFHWAWAANDLGV